VLRGLWHLTWLEIKIFTREPLGLVGTVAMPVLLFLMLGGALAPRIPGGSLRVREFAYLDVPVLAALLMALNAVLSLVVVIAIYRESGILKRLRATPLRPVTILSTQVLVKLFFTGVTVLVLALAGRRFYPVDLHIPWASFSAALAVSTVSIMSLGFVIASLVPTARFAQPVGSLILYPMLAVSGLFEPVSHLPAGLQVVVRLLPTTHAVSWLKGTLLQQPWTAHLGDMAGLVVTFVVCTAVASRLFRWE
jgi:ABC-2 type transport system permease protein